MLNLFKNNRNASDRKAEYPSLPSTLYKKNQVRFTIKTNHRRIFPIPHRGVTHGINPISFIPQVQMITELH